LRIKRVHNNNNKKKKNLQRAHSQALSMNRRREQSPGGRTEYVIANELGYEVRLEAALETV